MGLTPDQLQGNRLLNAAPSALREQLADIATLEHLDFKQLIFEKDTRIERVVFPLTGVCSLLSVPHDDDRIVEVATIGNEGFVGLPVFLQATLMSAHRVISQIEGEAIVLEAPVFLDISNSGGQFQAVLMRYAQALMTQISQGAACNRIHPIEQRCARWLLMTHDRVVGDRFDLTQEFLGQMLGVAATRSTRPSRRFRSRAASRTHGGASPCWTAPRSSTPPASATRSSERSSTACSRAGERT